MVNDSPRTVLLLVDQWVPGGVMKHILDLNREFSKLGVKSTVTGWIPPGVPMPSNIHFHPLPLYAKNGKKSLSGLFKSVRILRKIVQSGAFGIVHLHSRYTTLLAAMAFAGINIKRIYTAHNTFENLRFLPWYPREVICLNQAGKKQFYQNFFLRKKTNITVIPNGIEISANPTMPFPEKPGYTFTYVGRLEPQKGGELIIRAIDRLADPDVHVKIVGSGSHECELRALAERLGVGNQVEFTGFLNDPESVLDDSVALILPAVQLEGFGYVILEAFARQRAVIASDLAVFDDTVIDGKTGIRFGNCDHVSLAAAMQRALSDPDALRLMGKNGHDLLKDKYLLQRMAADTMEVYRKVLSKTGSK
jgi:glycosyltransferase involved in cell wall biosynthesis